MRRTIDGEPVNAATPVTKCYGCGMPLMAPNEYHPFEACEEYKRTGNSSDVERVLATHRLPVASD